MALTWALTLIINQFIHLKVHIVLTAVISLVTALIVYFFDLYKKNVITYILLAGIVPVLAFIFWIKKLNPIRFMKDYYNWCMLYDGTEEVYWAPWAYLSIFLVALLGAVLLYIITKKQAAKVILAIAILASLLVLCINRISIDKAVVGISIFYIMTIVVELYGYIYGKKTGRQDRKEGILYLAPICLMLAVFSIWLPSKPEPIKWTFVKDTYNILKERIEIMQTDFNYYFGGGDGQFLLSMSGYSEDGGDLNNGALTLDNKVALKVSGLTTRDIVYLTGSISDEYTGYSWEKRKNSYLQGEQDYLLDYLELFFCMSRQDYRVLEKNRFVKMKAVDITYNNIKTKTFFYPIKSSCLVLDSGKKKLNEESAQVTFKKARGSGTSYKNVYYEMNLEDEEFRAILRHTDTFSYAKAPGIDMDKAQWLQKNTFSRDNVRNVLEIKDAYQTLSERAQLIKENDMALPEELPERVKRLAIDITADYNSKYDKLKAIEDYLLKYKYTLNPKQVPEGEDFVDYFLFESKEGYCTSFATAMAVLGRCIGVPTRYVEGFVVNGKNNSKNNVCEVKNSQAHAWAEAYIEGIGWIPFEATASYYDIRYTKWPESEDSVSTYSSNEPYFSSNYYSNMHKYVYQPYIIGAKASARKNSSGEFVNTVIIIFAVIISLILAVLIYYYIMKYRYKKVYEEADHSKKMYLLFLRILRLLKQEGFLLDQQETILMLAKRVKDRYRYHSVTFRDVAEIFMHYRYAEAEVTNEQLEKVKLYQLGLANMRKEEENRFNLWAEEFIFLIQTDRQLRRRYNNT
jgi:hypothetical protein